MLAYKIQVSHIYTKKSGICSSKGKEMGEAKAK